MKPIQITTFNRAKTHGRRVKDLNQMRRLAEEHDRRARERQLANHSTPRVEMTPQPKKDPDR